MIRRESRRHVRESSICKERKKKENKKEKKNKDETKDGNKKKKKKLYKFCIVTRLKDRRTVAESFVLALRDFCVT